MGHFVSSPREREREIVEEMKVGDRGERGKGMKGKKPFLPLPLPAARIVVNRKEENDQESL